MKSEAKQLAEQNEWYILFLEQYIYDLETYPINEIAVNLFLESLKNQPIEQQQTKPPVIPIKPFSACGKCGLDLSGAMSYSCNEPTCPVYPQVTC